MRFRIVLTLLCVILVAGCVSNTKYQCATGEIVETLEECTLLPALETCEECPAPKIIEKEIEKQVIQEIIVEKINYVCPDGAVHDSENKCAEYEEFFMERNVCQHERFLTIEPTSQLKTPWYEAQDEGYINYLQFGLRNTGCSRFKSYQTDLQIFKEGQLIYEEIAWDRTNILIDKEEYQPIGGTVAHPEGLKITEKGQYTTILSFRNVNGDLVYTGSSYFVVSSD